MFEDEDSWGHYAMTYLIEKPFDWMFCHSWRTVRMFGVVVVVPWCIVAMLLSLIPAFAWLGWEACRPIAGEIKKVWDGPVCSEPPSPPQDDLADRISKIEEANR